MNSKMYVKWRDIKAKRGGDHVQEHPMWKLNVQSAWCSHFQWLCIKYLIAVKPFNAAPVELLKAEGMKKEFEGFFWEV